MSINRCDICKELQFAACSESLTIQAGLTPTDRYYIWLRDWSGREYVSDTDFEVQGDGSLIVTLGVFGDAVFTAHAIYELSISTLESEDESVMMTIGGEEYPCISLSFYDLN